MNHRLFTVRHLADAKAEFPAIDWDEARELDLLAEYMERVYAHDEARRDSAEDR